ncbi:Protein of unknown function [Gryllus bimaculatus]|nr:Protein of unknown function [Gryllus bimaculatus]
MPVVPEYLIPLNQQQRRYASDPPKRVVVPFSIWGDRTRPTAEFVVCCLWTGRIDAVRNYMRCRLLQSNTPYRPNCARPFLGHALTPTRQKAAPESPHFRRTLSNVPNAAVSRARSICARHAAIKGAFAHAHDCPAPPRRAVIAGGPSSSSGPSAKRSLNARHSAPERSMRGLPTVMQ